MHYILNMTDASLKIIFIPIMESILNTEQEIDVSIFDQVVLNSNNPNSDNKSKSEEILIQFKNQNSSWTKVDHILRNSHLQQSHYVALQILEDTVKTKWYVFDENVKSGIREYVFQLVVEKTKEGCRNYIIQELNRIIVEMAKRDWPKRWPNFINDLISVSTSISMDVCRNTLEILKKLNEDIFSKSDDRITTSKKRILRNQMTTEFSTIFNFIKMILEYSKTNEVDGALIEATLSSFASFCQSVPYDYVFMTDIVDLICEHINSTHSTTCLMCLNEIVELGKNKSAFNNMSLVAASEQKIHYIFDKTYEFVELYMKKFGKDKIHKVYRHMDSAEKLFILKISQLFASLFETYTILLESKNIQTTRLALECMLKFTKIDDSKIFIVLFEMWDKFVYTLHSEFPFNNKEPNKKLRRTDYQGILVKLLSCLVTKMPRPEEVFIVVNEYGEVIKNKLIETEQIEFYRKMKACFHHLAYLIEDDLKRYFLTKVGGQLEGNEWSWENVNKLCWSIGCVSSVFPEESEREFFVSILKYLLVLCEMRNSKADKAVVASNIMFIIGQYHRFLLHNKSFLKTVIKKLFEFMDETHEGVKDMACDNFYKICERCPRELLIQREGNIVFLNYVLQNIKNITRSLEFYQKRFVYEAVLLVIREIPVGTHNDNVIISHVDNLLMSVADVNIFSDDFIVTLPTSLTSVNTFKLLSHVIKSHSLVYKFVTSVSGYKYNDIFQMYFRLYDTCSNIMTTSSEPNAVINSRTLKTNIVELFIEVIEAKFLKDEFITRLCEKIIFDYKNNATYKDPVIIQLGTCMINNMSKVNNIQYVQIESYYIQSLIEPSISYVMKADEHPDIAVNYLKLLEACLGHSFNTFYSNLYASASFSLIYNSILYSIICAREISDLGLQIIHLLFNKCYETNQLNFFVQNYMITLENLLGIIFDKDTKHNFTLQASLLSLMCNIAKNIQSLDGTNDNINIISNHMMNLFTSSFPNITRKALELFISGLFELCKNEDVFREHLEDFGVKIYEFGTDEDIEDEVRLLKERITKCSQ